MAISSVVAEGYHSVQHDLVRRAQSGDRAAFGSLIQPRFDRLYSTASLIVRDAELAQDALQEALLEAWRDLRGVRDADRLDAWLHRLLVRSCVRAAKNRRLRHVAEVELAYEHDAAVPAVDIDRVVIRDELDRAFRRLTGEHRAILVLAYYADLSLADVAAVLEIPIGTAKSRLSRASEAFRAAVAALDRPVAQTGRAR